MKPKRGDTLLVGAGAVVSGTAGFAFTWLLARGAGAAGAGVVLTLTTWFMLLMNVTKLGMDTTSVREGARLRVGGAGASVRWIQRWTVVPVLVLSATTGLTIAALSGWIATWVVADAPVPLQPLIIVSAVTLPAAAYSIVQLGFLRGMGHVRPYVLLEQIGKPGLRAAGASLLVLLGVAAAGSYLAAWLLPVWVGALATWILARRRMPRAAREPMDPVERRRVIRFSSSRAVSQTADIANTSVGTLVLGATTTAAVAGQYGAAFRIVVAGQLLFQAVRILLAPSLAALLVAGDRRTASEVFSSGSALIVYAAWPLFLVCFAFPEAVLSLFGSGFIGASDGLRVLSLSGLFMAVVGNQGSVILMAGRGGAALVAIMAGLAVNLTVTFAFSGAYGALAAAWGWTLSVVVEGVVLGWALRGMGIAPLPIAARRAAARTLLALIPGLMCVLLFTLSWYESAAVVVATAISWVALCARDAKLQLHLMTEGKASSGG